MRDEAAHVLAAHVLGQSISTVELTDTGGEFRPFERASWEPTTAEGRERFRDAVVRSLGPEHLDEMLPLLVGLSAGLAAQRRIVGHAHDDYANADMEQCEAIAGAVAPGAESELRMLAQERAERIVTRHWRQIEALASKLLLHRQLNAKQIMAIIDVPTPQRLAYGYERRNGTTVPVARPTPGRETWVVQHRCDGFIA
jgi:hypothetical protein